MRKSQIFIAAVRTVPNLLAQGLIFGLLSTATATDYEVELRQIDTDVSKLGDSLTETPPRLERVTRYIYRLYHRAGLTGSPSDIAATESAIGRAIDRVGDFDDLWFLKA